VGWTDSILEHFDDGMLNLRLSSFCTLFIDLCSIENTVPGHCICLRTQMKGWRFTDTPGSKRTPRDSLTHLVQREHPEIH
jgi:hypothetical protein